MTFLHILHPFLQWSGVKDVCEGGQVETPIFLVYSYILLYIYYFYAFFHFFHWSLSYLQYQSESARL